jgi:SnoaL-like domain
VIRGGGQEAATAQEAATWQDGRLEGSYLRRNGDQQMGDSDGFSTLMHASLIEIFGQRDGTRRREAMRRTYAENVAFTDPEGTVHGYDAVDQRVRKILDDAPSAFVFTPDGPVYVGSGAAAALPWTFGPPDGPPAVRGIDIAAIANGRIASLQTLIAA